MLASAYVCEADVLLGATFLGEKLLFFGQGFDSIKAGREAALMAGYARAYFEGVFHLPLVHVAIHLLKLHSGF